MKNLILPSLAQAPLIASISGINRLNNLEKNKKIRK